MKGLFCFEKNTVNLISAHHACFVLRYGWWMCSIALVEADYARSCVSKECIFDCTNRHCNRDCVFPTLHFWYSIDKSPLFPDENSSSELVLLALSTEFCLKSFLRRRGWTCALTLIQTHFGCDILFKINIRWHFLLEIVTFTVVYGCTNSFFCNRNI